MVQRCGTIHLRWDRGGWKMAYLSNFWLVASAGNLSLQYVNSNICTLRFGLGVKGGISVGEAPKMHNILGLNQVGQLHLDK